MRRALTSELASRKSKRHKLDTDGKEDAGLSTNGEPEAQQRECYLDLLPDNVLEYIMQLMSASPRASAWAGQLANLDICTLFSLGGEMERVARECFSSLSFDAPSKGRRSDVNRLSVSSLGMSTTKLMNLASLSYITLEIRDPLSNLLRQPAHLDEFLRKCPNVKGLDISSTNTRIWLEKLGPKLERLETPAPTSSICLSISSYCTQLRQLHIGRASKCDERRSELWEKVGATLEALSVTYTFPAFKEIRTIQQHCREIRWLHILGTEHINPTLAECFVSYGEQLEYAFLPDMNESQLEAIVSACPNAVFGMCIEKMSHANSLELAGSRLEKAALFTKGVYNFSFLKKGWNACPNIEKVVLLDEVSLSYVRAIFTEPKPALLELELLIDLGEESSEVREIVDCIAEGTGSLRYFYLTTDGLADGLFDKLVARNQSLQQFICNADWYEDDGMCDVAKMAKNVLELPKLKYCWINADNNVEITNETHFKLKEVVRPLRHRQLVVTLIGHTYLH